MLAGYVRETNDFRSTLPQQARSLQTAAECSQFLRKSGQMVPVSQYQPESNRKTKACVRKIEASLGDGMTYDPSMNVEQIDLFLNGLVLQQQNLLEANKPLITYESYVNNIHHIIIRLYRIHKRQYNAELPHDLNEMLHKYRRTMHKLLPLSKRSVPCDAALISLCISGLDQGSDTVSACRTFICNNPPVSQMLLLCTNTSILRIPSNILSPVFISLFCLISIVDRWLQSWAFRIFGMEGYS